MKPAASSVTIRDFLAPLLIILPGAYLVWLTFAPLFVMPAAGLTALLSRVLFPETVTDVAQHGVFLVVQVQDRLGSAVPTRLQVYAPPLGAGLPLFLALSLASDATFVGHTWRVMLGIVLLILGQTTSILFKIAATLFSFAPPAVSADAFCSVDCYWAALYYVQYFTYMILPGLLPLIIWPILYLRYVQALIGPLVERSRASGRG